MKQLFIYASAFVVTLAACNNEKKDSNTTDTETAQETPTEAAPSTPSKSSNSEDVDARAAELQKLTPLSLDQLKALLPEELNGAKRGKVSGTANAKIAFASAEYVNGNKELHISLQDCAGSGAGAYQAQYTIVANAAYATGNNNGTFQVIDFNGGKATKAYDEAKKMASLTYMDPTNNRILATLRLRGANKNEQELEQIAQNLKFNVQ